MENVWGIEIVLADATRGIASAERLSNERGSRLPPRRCEMNAPVVKMQPARTIRPKGDRNGTAESTGDPRFYGFYAQASYMLTGETRPYRAEYGTFARPRPAREFRDGHGGKGAMELAFRFSRIDLDDEGVSGGRLNDLSVGFNWYPVHRTRVMLNYILANRSDAEPVSIFQGRLQVAF